jgi:hypothetical protein
MKAPSNNALKLTAPASGAPQLSAVFGGPGRQMRLIPSLAIAVGVLFPPLAVAGGTSYQVRVTAFEPGEHTKATFVIEDTSEEVMPGCKVARIVAEYRLWRWPWSTEKTFTRDAHLVALQRLREAFESGATTRFGIMGSGLARGSSDAPCVFRSRALALLDEESGARAVYSVYKYP